MRNLYGCIDMVLSHDRGEVREWGVDGWNQRKEAVIVVYILAYCG